MRTFLFKRGFSGRKYIFLTTIICLLTVAAAGGVTVAYLAADTPLEDARKLIDETKELVKKSQDAATAIAPYKTAIDDGAKSNKAEAATADAWETAAKNLKEKAEAAHKKLNESVTNLPKQDPKITEMIKRLKDLKEPAKTDPLLAELDEVQKAVKTETEKATTAQTGFKTSVDNLYKAADTATAALAKQLEKLSPYPDTNNGKLTLKDVPELLSSFDDHLTLQSAFAVKWGPLDTELKKLTASPSTKPADNLKGDFDAAVAILKKLKTWLGILTKYNSDVQDLLLKKRGDLDNDLPTHAVAALQLLKQSEDEQDKLQDMLSKSEAITKVVTADEKYPKEVRDNLPGAVKSLESTLEKFPRALSLVREGLAGDFDDFVADFVPLYNFTDVRNLIRILNPEMQEFRSVSALRDEAESARRNLDQADLNLINLRATVAEAQTRLRNLQDELKQAENSLANSTKLFTQQDRLITELESRPNPDTGRITRAKQRRDDLEAQKNADDEKLKDLTDEKDGLQPQITQARDQLLVAQKQVREGRSTMVRLAQIESGAFAGARDNEPVFYALNNVFTRDPVKQVIIYGFGSRKVIFLRGKEKDVRDAKDIISLFDRPAPQAKITLRTLEINSTADREGARKVNDALNFVETRLSNNRIKVATALSFLRDCINDEVNNIAAQKLNELRNSRGTTVLNNHRDVIVDDAEDLRWARLFFYESEVLLRLGFDPEISDANTSRVQSSIINHIALPDPVGTTTLGESLVILSMAKARYRYTIIDRFTREIGAKLRGLGLCPDCENEDICGSDGSTGAPVKWFTSLKRALGADQDHSGYFYTSMQKEIVNAITLATVPKLISRLADLQQIEKKLPQQDIAARIDTIGQMNAIQTFLWSNLRIYRPNETDSNDVSLPRPSPSPLSSPSPSPGTTGVPSRDMTKGFADRARSTNVLRTASAQVARADLMLKQLIDAVNEDMDRHFVRPMVSCLRTTLTNRKGIGVGVINETSVLATNRLVARVDPRASAQFSIGDTQDALQAAQQLANLYMAAQTGGFLGTFAGLGGLKQKDTSEIYGLTTGSTFKVNPIFDPTGQTLRFQFDYVGANIVTDPDGSTDPQLPRIERHTVNTEVQLNNFELREISRFESNARLGIATQYRGGFPIIKDIPYVKYIPLIGWFTRRSGKSAVVQQSLMLGQTTMYPTIADIFDLLNSDAYYYYKNATR